MAKKSDWLNLPWNLKNLNHISFGFHWLPENAMILCVHCAFFVNGERKILCAIFHIPKWGKLIMSMTWSTVTIFTDQKPASITTGWTLNARDDGNMTPYHGMLINSLLHGHKQVVIGMFAKPKAHLHTHTHSHSVFVEYFKSLFNKISRPPLPLFTIVHILVSMLFVDTKPTKT